MKKNLIISLATLSLVAITATSCNKEVEEQEKEDPNYTVLCDFEKGYENLNTAMLINYFGKISKNTNLKYVKSGKGSALLQPTGVAGIKVNPLMYFPLASNQYNFNKSNIANYDKVEFSMYNNTDKEVEAEVGFVADVVSVHKVEKSKLSSLTLKPRQWNDFSFEIDHAYFNLFFNIEEAPGLYFEFENANVYNPAFAPNIYLDDVRFYNAKIPHTIKDDFILKENEICDFEEDFQKYFISCANYTPDALKFDIVSEVDGVKPTSGDKFLCITVSAGGDYWADWSSAFLNEQYMRKTKLRELELEEEASLYRFEYDLRFIGTESLEANRVVTRFCTRGMTKSTIIVPCIDESKPLESENMCAPMNEWVTMGFQLTKEYAWAGDQTLCIDTNYTGVNTGRFEFSIGNICKEYKVLIDNIRLTPIAE